jgi:hypothetical protein
MTRNTTKRPGAPQAVLASINTRLKAKRLPPLTTGAALVTARRPADSPLVAKRASMAPDFWVLLWSVFHMATDITAAADAACAALATLARAFRGGTVGVGDNFNQRRRLRSAAEDLLAALDQPGSGGGLPRTFAEGHATVTAKQDEIARLRRELSLRKLEPADAGRAKARVAALLKEVEADTMALDAGTRDDARPHASFSEPKWWRRG